MDPLIDARRLNIDELRELMVQQRRFVLFDTEYCKRIVTEQNLIQPCRISGTELMVVGIGDKRYGRYLVAAASDYDVVLKELLAKHEAARNDDGLRADVGVAAAGCQDDDFLVGSPGADGGNHVAVDAMGVAADVGDVNELFVHRG